MNKIIKIIFFSILTFFGSNILFSQISQEWTVRYNGIGNDYDEVISVTGDRLSNVYITGTSRRNASNSDFITIKYNSSGILLWEARYNGPANDDDYSQAIILDDSGNVYVTGWSKGIGTYSDYATIKYNSSGQQMWVVRYNGIANSNDESKSIAIDEAQNIYITGQSYSNISSYDCVTIKYNSSGVEEWVASYNNLNNGDVGFVVKTDKHGNVFVGGYTGNIGSQADFLTIKYNSSGIQQWVAMFDGISHQTDEAKYLVLDTSGNIYVAGRSLGVSNFEDYLVIKYDSSGIERWSRRYDGSAVFIDQPCGLGLDKNNNIYIGGYSSENSSGYDFTVIKYNENGEQKWISHYNNVLNDFARSMTLDSLGNVYIIGDVIRSSTGSDYATVKFDSNGVQKWAMIYSTAGDSNDIPNAVAVDNSGSVYVAGYVNQQHPDCMTIKYSQLTGPTINESIIPADYKLSQNYPNPFNPVTNLEFGISKLGFVSLKVYDVLGSEIKTLVNENKPAGRYEVTFNGADFPSGVYFVRMESGDFRNIKRMVLIK